MCCIIFVGINDILEVFKMSKKNLDQDGQQKLERVIALVKGGINALPHAVRKVLKNVQPGRREYLRGELTRLAQNELKAKKTRVPDVKPAKAPKAIPRREWADAWRHEASMTNGMPKRDRS